MFAFTEKRCAFMPDWPPHRSEEGVPKLVPRPIERIPIRREIVTCSVVREDASPRVQPHTRHRSKPPRPPHYMYMPWKLCEHCGGQRAISYNSHRPGATVCSECGRDWKPVTVLLTNYIGRPLDALYVAEEYRRWKWREDGAVDDGFGLGEGGSNIIPFGWSEFTHAQERQREMERGLVPILDAALERVEDEGLYLSVKCPHCPGEFGWGKGGIHRHVLMWQHEWNYVSPPQTAGCELGRYRLRLPATAAATRPHRPSTH